MISRQVNLFLRQIIFGFFLFFPWRFKQKQIPILCYHSVGGGYAFSVSVKAFEKQLRYLKANGFRSITLRELVTAIRENKDLPSRSFVMTFDDGLKDNYSLVFPLLKKYGFTAVIFLVAEKVGRYLEWEQESQVFQVPLLSWAEVREMCNYGIQFEAHTCTHPHLTEISVEEARREIAQSKEIIEQKLGKEVSFFCYPYGDFNDGIRQTVRSLNFLGACSLRPGLKNDKESDIYCLRRIEIGPHSSLTYFKAVMSAPVHWIFELQGRFKAID